MTGDDSKLCFNKTRLDPLAPLAPFPRAEQRPAESALPRDRNIGMSRGTEGRADVSSLLAQLNLVIS
jgi:hypothetical protein